MALRASRLPVILAVSGALLCGSRAPATTFTVNSTTDAVDAAPGNGVCETATGNGVCSLRAAIQEANALAGPDVVIVPAGTYGLTLTSGLVDETHGDLDIESELVVQGAGSGVTVIDGLGLDNVLEVYPGATATVRDVTITHGTHVLLIVGGILNRGTLTLVGCDVRQNHAGTATQVGGGIRNQGVLTLEDTTVAENAASSGGGIFNEGTLTMHSSVVTGNSTGFSGAGLQNQGAGVTATVVDSTVIGNSAGAEGAGIRNVNGATLTLLRSTVSGNSAGQLTGGILNDVGSTATLTNSTISGNSAPGRVGIYNEGTITLLNGTVTDNHGVGSAGNESGGISNFNQGVFYLQNSIVAGNTHRARGPDCYGTVTSQGHNLIQNMADCTLVGDATGNLTGVDPKLDVLADNGGPTRTHALLSGSPAIDAADDAACPTTDQRSAPRPVDGDDDGTATCDMGAFEYLGVPPTTTVTSTSTTVTSTTTTSVTTTSSTTSTSTSSSSTSTTAPPPTTTSTTLPPEEICGDCVDNDGNGLTDFEDPACCAGANVLSLTLRRGRIKPAGVASKLSLRTLLGAAAAIDPSTEDVWVQLRLEGGEELLCARIPASAITKKGRTYRFKDRMHQVASAEGIDVLRLRISKKGTGRLAVSGAQAAFQAPGAASLELTYGFKNAAGADDTTNRCATSTEPFKANRRGALRFP